MKRLSISFILAAAAVAISLTSCSSQDDNPVITPPEIGTTVGQTFDERLPIYVGDDDWPSNTSFFSFKVLNEDPAEVELINSLDDLYGYTKLFIPETIENDGIQYRITSIGIKAFEFRNSPAEISIPASVRNLGYSAFGNCNNLKKFYIAPGTEPLVINSTCFDHCTSLTDVDIPGNVPVIQGFPFCTSLVNVTLHEGSNEIAEHAFYKCTALKEIHIPASIEIIWYGAFYDCTSLERVYLHGHPQIFDSAFPDTAQLIYVED